MNHLLVPKTSGLSCCELSVHAVKYACVVQAKQSLKHPWFEDLNMDEMDALENPEVIADALASVAVQ